jgi:hypothetical protein
MKSKPSASDAALDRVRAICMGFLAVEEKLSHGAPSFHVRGRMILNFVDDHHADGRLAVWCKATHEDQRRLVAEDPVHYFVPPYVGVCGWIGVRLDRPGTDWIALSILVEQGWTAVAPARIRDGKWVPTKAPPPPPVRKVTDAKVARDALARVTKVCVALPDVTCDREGQHATFRVKKKAFAYFLDNHHGDGIVSIAVKMPKAQAAALAKKDARFYLPAYIGGMGYVGVRLDLPRVDWTDVAARRAASHAVAGAKPKSRARPRTRGVSHSPR